MENGNPGEWRPIPDFVGSPYSIQQDNEWTMINELDSNKSCGKWWAKIELLPTDDDYYYRSFSAAGPRLWNDLSGGSREDAGDQHPPQLGQKFLNDYILGMYDRKCLTTPGCRQWTPADVNNKSIFN